MPRRKKQQIKELKQVDGKEIKPKPLTIDDLLGETKEKFEGEKSEYVKQLNGMNKIDLQHECIRLGEMPHDNRDIMKNRLVKAFNIHLANKKMRLATPKTLTMTPKLKEALAGGSNCVI